MERERAGQPDTPQEPPQSPTGAATTPEGTTPPQEPEPPQERTEATGGWLQETGAGAVGGSVQVAPSPTQPTQKQPSEYTLSDFEAMDDAAFQRFVDMSSGEFGKYLSGISWADRVHVIGRRERAQPKSPSSSRTRRPRPAVREPKATPTPTTMDTATTSPSASPHRSTSSPTARASFPVRPMLPSRTTRSFRSMHRR